MKLPLTFVTICSLFSCTTTLYQVQTTSSKNVKTDFYNNDLYEDSIVAIKYNFWSKGGTVYFTILNKTDSALYIDWTKSNLVYNGYRYDYMINTNTVTSDSVEVYKETDESLNGITYIPQEEPQMYLPPHSYIKVHRFNLNRESTLEFNTRYGKNAENTEVYTDKNTPLIFRNHLKVSKNPEFSNPHFVNNTFWVSTTSNYTKKEFNNLHKPIANSFYATKRVFNVKGTVIIASSVGAYVGFYVFLYYALSVL